MKKTPTTAHRFKQLRKLKPELKWQTGAYSCFPTFHFALPYSFLLLCKLVGRTPENILIDFMENLGCGSRACEGRETAKKYLQEYFIAQGYGQHLYSEEELRRIFQEMDAVGLLFPKDGNTKMIDAYTHWRKKHYRYWFKKWLRKPQRKC